MINIRLKTIAGFVLLLAVTGCDSSSQGAYSQQNAVSNVQPYTTAPTTNVVQKTTAKIKAPWPYLHENSDAVSGFENMLKQNFFVVFDGSGSMSMRGCNSSYGSGERKMDVAKKALIAFSKIVPADANLGLIAFDERGVEELVKLGEGTRQGFDEKVSSVSSGGMTPLKTSIQQAYKRLTERARSQLGYGEYHLVVVTDGEASEGENPEETVNQILSESPVVIHTVGFCIDSRHSLNQPGRILYRSANNYESLKTGLSSVLAEAPDFSVSDFK